MHAVENINSAVGRIECGMALFVYAYLIVFVRRRKRIVVKSMFIIDVIDTIDQFRQSRCTLSRFIVGL